MSFRDIKGQDKAVEIIKECIRQDKTGRGYLFAGPEGVGKKLSAKTFAKSINCKDAVLDSCGGCASCLKIEKNQHPDVHFIDDSDSGSIKIDDVRRLQKDITLMPYEAEKKIFVIDNAHNLTPEASAALLKTLEEPPKNSLIILISSKRELLFKTIISRCQIIKFYSMQRAEMRELLKKDYAVDALKAHFLSFFSEGSLGRALRLKDSGIFTEKNMIIDEFGVKHKSFLENIPVEGREQMLKGARGDFSLPYILNILTVWFRDIYMLKAGMEYTELTNSDRKEDLSRQKDLFSFNELDAVFSCISDALLRIEQNVNTKLLLSNLRLMFN